MILSVYYPECSMQRLSNALAMDSYANYAVGARKAAEWTLSPTWEDFHALQTINTATPRGRGELKREEGPFHKGRRSFSLPAYFLTFSVPIPIVLKEIEG